MARKPARQLSKRAMLAKSTARALTAKPAPLVSQDELKDLFSTKSLLWIQRRLNKGEHIAGPEMAIEANPGQPLPKDVLDYLCRYLRGQIKKKPGPQTSDSTDEVITEIAAAVFYQAELSRLQNEAKNKGRRPKGSTPLHEQAAMFVKKQFVGREPVRVDDGLNI